MDFEKLWAKALRTTEIVRPRVQGLETYSETRLPYIFLAESSVNRGDTVVRRGEVTIERPAIVLPPNMPQFEGFEFDAAEGESLQEEFMKTFFLVRGISFPSLKYRNSAGAIDVREGGMKDAVRHFLESLQKHEDVGTGLVTGSEDCWQFAVLLLVCGQALRAAPQDIKRLLGDYRAGLS